MGTTDGSGESLWTRSRQRQGICSPLVVTLWLNTLSVAAARVGFFRPGPPHWEGHQRSGSVTARSSHFVLSGYRNTSNVHSALEWVDWPTLERRRQISRLSMLHRTHSGLVHCLSLPAKATTPTPHLFQLGQTDSHSRYAVVDSFYIVLFSALEQAHWAFVTCDRAWVTVAFMKVRIRRAQPSLCPRLQVACPPLLTASWQLVTSRPQTPWKMAMKMFGADWSYWPRTRRKMAVKVPLAQTKGNRPASWVKLTDEMTSVSILSVVWRNLCFTRSPRSLGRAPDWQLDAKWLWTKAAWKYENGPMTPWLNIVWGRVPTLSTVYLVYSHW